MKKSILVALLFAIIATACNKTEESSDGATFINDQMKENTISALKEKFGEDQSFRIERGVDHLAGLWIEKDGDAEAFKEFCLDNFIDEGESLDHLFSSLSRNYEVIWGNFLKMQVELNEPVHMDMGELQSIDHSFAAFNASAHLTEDLYNNRIAYITVLNFPTYTLEEKQDMGKSWNSKQWAYVRMGDMYQSRIPAELQQKSSEIGSASDTYIAEYNIWMDMLTDADGNQFFDDSLKLISHWGLRDQLKADYAVENGIEKQKMIYEVMKRIIFQEIPSEVINSREFKWDPHANITYKDGTVTDFVAEDNVRYQHMINHFRVLKEIDAYTPMYPDYIARHFEGGMEIPQEEVENLFIEFVSSEQVKKVAELIKKRLGRDLQPFDIWYTGFRGGGAANEAELDVMVSSRYPDAKAFENGIPAILENLDFTAQKSQWLASKMRVDASRGAGHAWGAAMRSEKARLRTRIPQTGMNYKGFNIAMHELGHNVEQTITLHDVDHYMLNGVPNTAFTEALAFVFQKRDMKMLGIEQTDPLMEHTMALDIFWSSYEIMGVSLVDMNVWKWMYANPDATPEQLKEAVIRISKEIWNKYYAEVFGIQDEPILGIYSHMIDNPLYLSAYPVGHLIDFQLEQFLAGKNFAEEVIRIYSQGKLAPQVWMMRAVGEPLSVKPLLNATETALINIKN